MRGVLSLGLLVAVLVTVTAVLITAAAAEAPSTRPAVPVVAVTSFGPKGERLNFGSGIFITQKELLVPLDTVIDAARVSVNLPDGSKGDAAGVAAVDIESGLVILDLTASGGARPVRLHEIKPTVGAEVSVVGPRAPITAAKVITDRSLGARNAGVFGIEAVNAAGANGAAVTNSFGDVVGVHVLTSVGGRDFSFIVPARTIAALKAGPSRPITAAVWPPPNERVLRAGLDASWAYIAAGQEENLKRCLQADPKNSLAWYYWGIYSWGNSDTYERAIENKPEDGFVYMTMASYFSGERAAKYYRLAIESFAKAASPDPEILLALGNSWHFMGNHAAAVPYLRRAIDSRPLFMEAYIALGSSLVRQGKCDEAISVYKSAVEIEPHFGAGWQGLGWASKKKDKMDDAGAAFTRAVELEPWKEDRVCALCDTLCDAGRSKEAIPYYQKAVALNRDSYKLNFGLGRAYRAAGQNSNAIDTFRAAAAINGEDPELWAAMGWSYFELDFTKEAREAFSRALASDPHNVEYVYGMGVTYGKEFKADEALKYYNEAIRLQPDLLEAHMAAGAMYVKKQDRENAMREYNVVLNLDKTERKQKASSLLNLINRDLH